MPLNIITVPITVQDIFYLAQGVLLIIWICTWNILNWLAASHLFLSQESYLVF